MRRKRHVLSRIKKCEIPPNWIFFDCETDVVHEDNTKQVQALKLGVAWHVRLDKKQVPLHECVFTSPETFASFVLRHVRSKSSLYVASLNIAFDLAASQIVPLLQEKGWKVASWSANDGTSFLVMKDNGKRIVFLDVLNYFKTSVKELGRVIGIEKLEVDPFEASTPDLIEYCRRDVEIITRAMLQLFNYIRENDLGGLGLSISSTAFKAYRHRFMPFDIHIHDDEEALTLERLSYFGGRTECFHIGPVNRKIYVLDVNSMYPFVMRYNVYPVKLVRFRYTSTPAELIDLIERGYCVIAHVLLKTNEPAYPYRMKDKLIFPVGVFDTYLTTPSLRYALINKHVVESFEYAAYIPQPIFTDYVEYFYRERLRFKAEGNTVYEYLCKLMLNSLYGKFGQRKRDIIESDEALLIPPKTPVYDVNGEYLGRAVSINGQGFLVSPNDDEAYNSFPAIAAHVTDYARMYLWHLIKEAGLNNVYYVDTDSLHVNSAGYVKLAPLIDAQGLGKLKLENVAYFAHYLGPKHYVLGEKYKCKGISAKAIRLNENTYLQYEFPSLRTAIIDNPGCVIINKVTKTLKPAYDKGEITPSGRIKPIKLHVQPPRQII